MSDRVVWACKCQLGLDLSGPRPWAPYLRSCNNCHGDIEEINIDSLLRIKQAVLELCDEWDDMSDPWSGTGAHYGEVAEEVRAIFRREGCE